LKPSNLMMSDETGQVKIVDFGIARMAEQSRLTRTGNYLGTLPYMAPEQMEAVPLDGRADLYSFGCVLHEMVADRSPYDASTPMQWMAAHQLGTPAPLRTQVPDASRMLESLILSLLAKQASDRPADADIVGNALAAIEAELMRPQAMGRAERTAAGPERPIASPMPSPIPESVPASPPPMVPGSPPPMVPGGPARSGTPAPNVVPIAASPLPSQSAMSPLASPLPRVSSPPVSSPPVRSQPVSPPASGLPVSPAVSPAFGAAAPIGQRPAGSPPVSPAPYGLPHGYPGGVAGLPGGPISGAPLGPPAYGEGLRRGRAGLIAAAVVAVVAVAALGVAFWPGHLLRSSSTNAIVPAAGECFGTGWANAVGANQNSVWSVDDHVSTVTCTRPHAFEVVAVRGGTASAAANPPAVTSAALAAMYATCTTAADDFLGGDWRSAYAWLGVALPQPAAWHRGAHWSACVLLPTATWEGALAQSSVSLRDGLRGTRSAAIGCIDAQSRPTSCAAPHTYEAVGVFRATASPFPGAVAGRDEFSAGCESKLAQYLGLTSVSKYHNTNVGWSWWPAAPSQQDWNLGNRSALCAAYAQGASHLMSGSVKGLGNKAPSS
jgi:hypothetical protein